MVLPPQNGIVGSDYGDGSSYLTPFDIFFNTYKILDINFFDLNDLDTNSFIYKFRTSVAYWFYTLRFISSAILLCILVYVGIKMAISSVADDKAKYKKMLIDWCCSLALIFLLQYIGIGIIYLNNTIVDGLRSILVEGDLVEIKDLMNDLALNAVTGIGISSIVSVGIYCGIVAQSIFFFISYLNRMLKIGFLIIISPLISLTYAIDKMGDGKAQAVNNEAKEFLYTVFIQPFHGITYIALINPAFKLVTGASAINIFSLPNLFQSAEFNKLANGLLAILCLKFINNGEKIVRKIFGFADDNSKTSMAAGAVAAVALVSNAKKIGTSTRSGINMAKRKATDIGNALGADIGKLKNSDLYNKLSNSKAAQSSKRITNQLMNKAQNTAKLLPTIKRNPNRFQGIKNLANSASTLAGKYKGSGLQKAVNLSKRHIRKGMPIALGAMGMMMAYSTGDTGVLSAHATGKGITDGSRALFNSSTNTQADWERKNMQDVDDAEHNELMDDIEAAKDEIEEMGYDKNITSSEAKQMSNSPEAKALAERIKDAQKKVKQEQSEYNKAERAAQAARETIAKEQENKAKAKSHAERSKAQKKIDAATKELKNREDQKTAREKSIARAQLEADTLKERSDKYKKLENAVQKRDLLEKQKLEYYTEDAMKDRIRRKMSGPSNSELEKKKSKILQLIMKFQLEQSNSETGEISESDSDNARLIADNITGAVDIAVLKGKTPTSVDKIMKNSIPTNDKASKTLENINKTVEEYEKLKKEASIAQAFSRHLNYNGEIEDLVNAMYGNLRNREK